MTKTIVWAATEYFASRGYSRRYARMNAAISVACYAFANYLTAVCLYYAVAGRFPTILKRIDHTWYGLFMLLLMVVAWLISGRVDVGSAVTTSEPSSARARVWKVYYLGSLGVFLVACAMALVRMG